MTTSVVGGGADQRRDRKAARTSVVKSFGSCQAAKWLPLRPPLDPPEEAEHSGRGGNNRHATAPSTLRIAVAVGLGGVLDPLGVRHDRAPFAQPTGWRPAWAQPGCAVLTLIG
jgi:hypothetical protein